MSKKNPKAPYGARSKERVKLLPKTRGRELLIPSSAVPIYFAFFEVDIFPPEEKISDYFSNSLT